MLKSLLYVIFFGLSFSRFGMAGPTVEMDVLVDGAIKTPPSGVVEQVLGRTESYQFELKEVPVVGQPQVARIFSGSIITVKIVSNHSTEVIVHVSRKEMKNGTIQWWAQVQISRNPMGGVSRAVLRGTHFYVKGAPEELPDGRSFEPRVTVDMK